jgi:hypothetical protein
MSAAHVLQEQLSITITVIPVAFQGALCVVIQTHAILVSPEQPSTTTTALIARFLVVLFVQLIKFVQHVD